MGRLRRLGCKTISAVLLALILFQSLGVGSMAYATPDPELEVLPPAISSPSLVLGQQGPIIKEPVTVEVEVVNNGGPCGPSTVTLEWCCGEISRPLPALMAGDSEIVEFRSALVFTEPGVYDITATVDKANLIAEEDEANNSVTTSCRVWLRVEPLPEEPEDWADEVGRIDEDCPYTSPMDIGVEDPGLGTFLEQEGRACGTTCLAAILRYFDEECCHQECEPSCIDQEIRSTTGWDMFTEPIGIEEYTESKDLNAEIYVNGNLQRVRWLVDRGIPVMLDIITEAGSTDVNEGHWVVVLSVCEVPETIIEVYCPRGYQFAITPERLERFWGGVALSGIPLWNRLFIAISDQSLPSGDTDEVRSQLALAQALAMAAIGLQDLFEGAVLEGIVELVGGIGTFFMGVVSYGLAWAEDEVPLIGGMLGSLGQLGGDLTLICQDLVNIGADLLDPTNWVDLERMGELIEDLLGTVADTLEAIAGFIADFMVDGIGGLLVDLWDGITAGTCWTFGLGCPEGVVYYKHYVSTDPCLETNIFLNGLERKEALGYIYTYPAPGTKPIWLYADSMSSLENREYYLCDDGDWADPTKVSLGMIGYSLESAPPTSFYRLTIVATNRGLHIQGDVGYLPREPEPGTTILWLMKVVGYDLHTVSSDPCAMTQTFFTLVVKGYTRELPVALIPPSETEGAVKLYRFYNPDLEDCLLTTDDTLREGYVNHGYLGYIYTAAGAGRVPLYQFYNSQRKDHLITVDPNAEGLDGYGSPERLGYVLPTSELEPEDWTCNVPLWRFCKRIYKEE